MGWNSLVGFGFGLGYSLTPNLGLDAGFGVASIGRKAALRLRYNVLATNWTPVFGLGVQYGPGTGTRGVELFGDDGTSTTIMVERSAFLQALAAMAYQGDAGFTALFGLGYSALLDKRNVRLVAGSEHTAANEHTADLTQRITGSGIALETAIGYAF